MKSKIKLAMLFSFIMLTVGCTENASVREYGGTMEMKLNKNERFVNITWKENDLWIVVEDTVEHKFIFREKSRLGLAEGKVIISK